MIGHHENLKCQSGLHFIVLFLLMFISASDLIYFCCVAHLLKLINQLEALTFCIEQFTILKALIFQ
jgi:hypothetical protein